MNQLQNLAYGYGAQTFVPLAAQSPSLGEQIRPDYSKMHSRLDSLGLYEPGYVIETPEQIARHFEQLYPSNATLQTMAAAPGMAAQGWFAQPPQALQHLERQVQLLQEGVLWYGRQLAALALHIASTSELKPG